MRRDTQGNLVYQLAFSEGIPAPGDSDERMEDVAKPVEVEVVQDDEKPPKPFQQLSSIDYSGVDTPIYKSTAPSEKEDEMAQWLVYSVTGVSMGFIAFSLDLLVEKLSFFKLALT